MTSDQPGPREGRRQAAAYLAVAALLAAALALGIYLERRSRAPLPGPEDESEAGLIEAAQDARRVLLVPAGVRVAAGSSVVAREWAGRHVDLAHDLPGLQAQVDSGLCDYVVIDSFWVRRQAPALKLLVTGPDPLPGAGLVYRRYFADRERMLSVFKIGAPPFRVNFSAASVPPEQALTQARELRDQGHLEHARQVLEDLAAIRPDAPAVHRELLKVYLIYGNFDGVSLDRAEDELIKYGLKDPDANRRTYQDLIKSLRTRHRAMWGE